VSSSPFFRYLSTSLTFIVLQTRRLGARRLVGGSAESSTARSASAAGFGSSLSRRELSYKLSYCAQALVDHQGGLAGCIRVSRRAVMGCCMKGFKVCAQRELSRNTSIYRFLRVGMRRVVAEISVKDRPSQFSLLLLPHHSTSIQLTRGFVSSDPHSQHFLQALATPSTALHLDSSARFGRANLSSQQMSYSTDSPALQQQQEGTSTRRIYPILAPRRSSSGHESTSTLSSPLTRPQPRSAFSSPSSSGSLTGGQQVSGHTPSSLPSRPRLAPSSRGSTASISSFGGLSSPTRLSQGQEGHDWGVKTERFSYIKRNDGDYILTGREGKLARCEDEVSSADRKVRLKS